MPESTCSANKVGTFRAVVSAQINKGFAGKQARQDKRKKEEETRKDRHKP
ncbi:MAG TPA: hypothetical protein VH186_15755 [Chloroflexia bacterium]|nr:hypothetical protein [Chloroflexia bacterium]